MRAGAAVERDHSDHPSLDHTIASAARMWDALRAGKDSGPLERAAVLAVDHACKRAGVDTWRRAISEHDEFRARAVGWLAGQRGVRQFADLGTGYPSFDASVERVTRWYRDVRVANVDNNPLVVVHGRALLDGGQDRERVAHVVGDLCEPASIVEDDGWQRVIRPDEPVGLVLTAVLHWLEMEPEEVVAPFAEAAPPGSYLVVSHIASDGYAVAAPLLAATMGKTLACYPRPAETLAGLVPGWTPVGPGVTFPALWTPDVSEVAATRDCARWLNAAVWVKP